MQVFLDTNTNGTLGGLYKISILHDTIRLYLAERK